jgi:hypothetical protein
MGNGRSTDERLADLEQTVAYLSRLVLKARQYAETDPEVALGQARKSAEAICYRLFQDEIGPPGKMMLEELMTKLQARQVIPLQVLIPLRTIQMYGNFGVHAQDGHGEVSVEWVAPCLSALAQVTNWYFRDYLGIALPTALERHEDDSRPVTRHGGWAKEPRGETAGDRPWNGQPAEPAPAPPTPSLLVVEADEGPPWMPGSVAGPSVADTLPQPDPDPVVAPASEAVAAEGPVAEPTESAIPDRPAPASPTPTALGEEGGGAVDDSISWTPGSIAGPTVADTLPQPDPVVEPAPEVVPTDEPITGPTIPDPPPGPAPRWRPAALAGGLLLLGLGGVYLYHEVRQDDEPRPAPAVTDTDRPAQGAGVSPGQAVAVPDMVRLPAGRFRMGSPAQEPERDKDEGPQHQVQVAAFDLGKTEVTRGQFKQFVQATGYRTEAEEGDGCYGWKDGSWTKDKVFNWRNVGFAQEDDSRWFA